MTSRDGYANIEDFEWYFAVLVDLAYVSPIPGPELKDSLIDVAVRVKAIRPYAVKLCSRLLGDDVYVNNATSHDNGTGKNEKTGPSEVLSAAAWICGEYAQYGISLTYCFRFTHNLLENWQIPPRQYPISFVEVFYRYRPPQSQFIFRR